MKIFDLIGYVLIFIVAVIGFSCHSTTVSVEPVSLQLEGNLQVHDPVIIKENDTYYVFATGRGGGGIIPIRSSKDMCNWTLTGHVLDSLPEWATKEIRGARDAWAPDISYYNGKFHLYYSVSTFGRNTSAIGLATNDTLDPCSPKYKWVDRGMVVKSVQGEDDWNAIDPQLVYAGKNNVWLCWGSFWGGIKMRRIDPATGLLSKKDTKLYSLASRPRTGEAETPPTQGSIEAPFIIRHDEYWYLFASYDFCCRGARSTYNIRVGRSKTVTGPYIDKEGKPMLEGGGTMVLEADANDTWRGPGHEAVLHESGQDFLIFHAYDSNRNGRSFLQISTIAWVDGWHNVAPLPKPTPSYP
jgi:arabinan endo-1,5-alpha-L-arabinosidase